MANDLRLVREVLADLSRYQLTAVVFGGWAEELRGLIPARPHRDIDLLLLEPDTEQLELFLRSRHEVLAKRSSQKRAFVQDRVCVELFLTHRDADGWATRFWDQTLLTWPDDLHSDLGDLAVASQQTLALYRETWLTIHGDRPT